MDPVRFWVLVDNELTQLSLDRNDTISFVFDLAKGRCSSVLSNKLAHCNPNQCTYFKLRVPIRVGDRPMSEIEQACMDQHNWEKLSYDAVLKHIWPQFLRDHVYVAVQLPPDWTKIAIDNLERSHKELFTSLQITVRTRGYWLFRDVITNGGAYVGENIPLPPEVSEIERRLNEKRTYQDHGGRDLLRAQSYSTHFSTMFQLSASTNQSATVINDREFATFYNVLRCYQEDAQQVKLNQSSSLKASTFMTSFIQPVFFSLRSEAPFQYKEQLSWEFPIFISFSEFPDSWWKYTPNSNFSVISLSHLCPFVVAEVISRQHEEARYRMLLQAVAASRAGRYLLKPRSQKRFFTVAICLTAELIAERYIVCPAESGSQVHIATQHFDLTNAHQAVVFLRELYNLATLIDELASELDEGKTQELNGIRQVASKMASLHTRRSSLSSPRTTGSALSSINERDEMSEMQDEDDLGIFGSDEVRCVLEEMSYKAAWIAFGHPDIATVLRRVDDSAVGYLKFVKEGSKEVEILQYLTQFDSLENHTICPIRMWTINGGTVVLMPIAGGWITSLEDPDSHLWPVAQQLFEAVGFMHDHGVAHMDLKPANIIVPLAYGRLTIIDFSVSVRVNSPQHIFEGYTGTKGYIAPEVGKGAFSPIRADLWSCGKVIEELCSRCQPSDARERLLAISNRLTHQDPRKRPTIAEILRSIRGSNANSDGIDEAPIL